MKNWSSQIQLNSKAKLLKQKQIKSHSGSEMNKARQTSRPVKDLRRHKMETRVSSCHRGISTMVSCIKSPSSGARTLTVVSFVKSASCRSNSTPPPAWLNISPTYPITAKTSLYRKGNWQRTRI